MDKSQINRIFGILLIILVGFVLIYHYFFNKVSLWFLILCVVLYLIGMGLLFRSILVDFKAERNYLQDWRYLHNYFSGVGYSLIAGGLVALVTNNQSIAWGIITSGALISIIGAYFLIKIEKFEEKVRVGEIKRNKRNKK